MHRFEHIRLKQIFRLVAYADIFTIDKISSYNGSVVPTGCASIRFRRLLDLSERLQDRNILQAGEFIDKRIEYVFTDDTWIEFAFQHLRGDSLDDIFMRLFRGYLVIDECLHQLFDCCSVCRRVQERGQRFVDFQRSNRMLAL